MIAGQPRISLGLEANPVGCDEPVCPSATSFVVRLSDLACDPRAGRRRSVGRWLRGARRGTCHMARLVGGDARAPTWNAFLALLLAKCERRVGEPHEDRERPER